jgi:hypothetical protein
LRVGFKLTPVPDYPKFGVAGNLGFENRYQQMYINFFGFSGYSNYPKLQYTVVQCIVARSLGRATPSFEHLQERLSVWPREAERRGLRQLRVRWPPGIERLASGAVAARVGSSFGIFGFGFLWAE